ncbi:TonB-dependent receptor plug domain-containing protein [Kriegella sp. EG-1]|nr:TonB-dependent receptor plug domain-containing protein [Flavobacteriaceae bacterium EG-1]
MIGQTASITGVVLDENNQPIAKANIKFSGGGTFTDENGFYLLKIIAEQETTITFSFLGLKNIVVENLILNTNEIFEFNPIMKVDVIQVDGVTVTPTGEKNVEGVTTVPPVLVRKIPGANAGVENILKLLPGVSSNNELSTQYAVRGGNYDENLVYINEIEVYRPFLIRAAQQEGLSFVNSNLTQNVKFSPGGFQAKYGDKLSSVLDITYKNPTTFETQIDLSFLGTSASVESLSKNKKFGTITGLRYRNNSLLVNSQETESNFNPVFVDLQSFSNYRFSNKFELGFLGNISVNDYQNEPLNRETNFGTLNQPRRLTVLYQGNEKSRYSTLFGALKGTYHLNENVDLKLISSIYHTTEEEYSDIISTYKLGGIEADQDETFLGDPIAASGLASQFNRTRNDLDALIFNFQHKGTYRKDETKLEWGAKFTHEDIRDQLRESEFIDSVGFSIRPPVSDFSNNEPYEPFNDELAPYTNLNATNFVKTNRFSAFAQISKRDQWGTTDIYYNLGFRGQLWTVSGTDVPKVQQSVLSPRAQFAVKPNWYSDIIFRISGGLYHQPPFYRELRDNTGTINSDVKAQNAIHIVLGTEYSFLLWERPFNLTGELYYKDLNNVNTYTLDDVRIRYSANNNAIGYAYGAELRMNGAFVPGTESWVSIGYLQTKENLDSKGFISRPTDQRLKVGLLFQDYIPNIPNLRMYLNLVYNTGVPGGSPSYADPYIFQNRLTDYKRADLGISYIFVDADKNYPSKHWLNTFKDLSIGIEIFNMFNNQNSITNTWVRDIDSKIEYAIPNYMTSRVLNLRLKMRL